MANALWSTRYLITRNTFLLTSWIGFGIATLCFAGRIITRLHIFHKLSLDDLFVLAAWLSSLVWSVVWQIKSENVYLNIKVQVHEMPLILPVYLARSYDYMSVQIVAILCQAIGLWCVKYAFLAFFWKLGPSDGIRSQRIVWWIAFAYTSAALVAYLGVIPWKCVANLHDLAGTFKRCSTPALAQFTMASLYVQTVLDITSDISILAIPFTLLWQVKIRLRRKVTLGCIFSITLFIILCAMLRAIVVSKTAVKSYIDITWLYLWHIIELDTAIVVACLASFRALFTVGRTNSHYQDSYAMRAGQLRHVVLSGDDTCDTNDTAVSAGIPPDPFNIKQKKSRTTADDVHIPEAT